MRPRLLFSLGLGLTILILPFFAASVYWLGYRYYHDHPRTEATVTSLREFTPRVAGGVNYLAVVSMTYPVESGRVQQAHAQFFTEDVAERNSWQRQFTPGKRVDIRYARAMPERIVVADRDFMDKQARLLLPIIAALGLISVSLTFVGKRKAV